MEAGGAGWELRGLRATWHPRALGKSLFLLQLLEVASSVVQARMGALFHPLCPQAPFVGLALFSFLLEILLPLRAISGYSRIISPS